MIFHVIRTHCHLESAPCVVVLNRQVGVLDKHQGGTSAHLRSLNYHLPTPPLGPQGHCAQYHGHYDLVDRPIMGGMDNGQHVVDQCCHAQWSVTTNN